MSIHRSVSAPDYRFLPWDVAGFERLAALALDLR